MGVEGSARPPAGRGGRWVAAQGVLLLAVFGVGIVAPDWPASVRSAFRVVDVLLALAGLTLALSGIRHLGPSLTPFPAPVEGGELREDGVYALVRHPIYGGGWLVALGWSLWASPWALVPTVLLAILFEGKRRREEAWLLERYPGYEAYRAAVPRRFIPFVV